MPVMPPSWRSVIGTHFQLSLERSPGALQDRLDLNLGPPELARDRLDRELVEVLENENLPVERDEPSERGDHGVVVEEVRLDRFLIRRGVDGDEPEFVL